MPDENGKLNVEELAATVEGYAPTMEEKLNNVYDAPYAVRETDVSGYVNVSPEYKTHTEGVEGAPLHAQVETGQAIAEDTEHDNADSQPQAQVTNPPFGS